MSRRQATSQASECGALGQADYEVGYGKPPKATRFRKGQSGNPKGRPKGARSASWLLEQALAAPVTITEGGATRVIEKRMALFKALVARAIKGDARSAALVVRLMDRFGLASASPPKPAIVEIRRTIVRPGDPLAPAKPLPRAEDSE